METVSADSQSAPVPRISRPRFSTALFCVVMIRYPSASRRPISPVENHRRRSTLLESLRACGNSPASRMGLYQISPSAAMRTSTCEIGSPTSPLYISWHVRSDHRRSRLPVTLQDRQITDQKNSEAPVASGATREKYRILPPRPRNLRIHDAVAICQRCFVQIMDSCRTLATESIPAPHAKTSQKTFLSSPSRDAPVQNAGVYLFEKTRHCGGACRLHFKNACGTDSICSTYAIETPRNR